MRREQAWQLANGGPSIGPVWTLALGPGLADLAVIDDIDFDIISKYRWRRDKDGYAVTSIAGGGKVGMHQIVIGPVVDARKPMPDHRNRLRMDNRRSNLRFVTHRENVLNSTMRADNTSGIKGVSYSKHDDRWVAQVGTAKQKRFTTKDEAHLARVLALIAEFGSDGVRY